MNKNIAGAKLNNPNYDKDYKKEWYRRNRDRLLEKKRQYQLDNKEDILEKAKEYRGKHKERISAWKRTKVQCSCGSNVSKGNLSRHARSKKHQAWEDSQ